MAIRVSGSRSFVAFSASSRQLSWDTVTSYSRYQATFNFDLGLCNIEHPETVICVIVSSITNEALKPLSRKALSSPAGRFFISNRAKLVPCRGRSNIPGLRNASQHLWKRSQHGNSIGSAGRDEDRAVCRVRSNKCLICSSLSLKLGFGILARELVGTNKTAAWPFADDEHY